MPASIRLLRRVAALAAVVALWAPGTVSADGSRLGAHARGAAVSATPSSAVLLASVPRAGRVVALTFDDGYNSPVCEKLVDELVALRTPATFFPNAAYVRASPRLWRRVAALGFPIGNHTTTHPLMTQLSFDQQKSQISSDRSIVDAILGTASLSVFRPPYGAWNATTLLAASAAGYPIVLNWDTTFADSSHRPDGSPWPITSYVRSATAGSNGSVILGHCGSRIDVEALPSVVESYLSRGFTFVTVPQLVGMPGAQPMQFPVAPPRPPAPDSRHRPV